MSVSNAWPWSIRLFHLANALLFVAVWWLFDGGEQAHAYAGYAIAVLVLWRVARGLYARDASAFRAFWPSPARLRHYLRIFPDRHGEFAGHNPLGALMILALLTGLLLTVASGWLQETDRFWGEEWVQVLHRWLARLVLAAVVVHVLAVLLMQRLSGQPLLRRMFAGLFCKSL